jgi:hypothetical protein
MMSKSSYDCAQGSATRAATSFKTIPARLAACALALGLATTAQAALITGDPQGNSFGWVPNSTNALNFAQLTPGRVGQAAPHVLFNSATAGSVTLDFFNPASGLAFFEIRIDGIATGASPHPVVTGDTIHTGGNGVATGTSELGLVYSATSFVDVRLALGGERDWDFDWTRFEVAAAAVPEPGTLAILGIGLAGLAFVRRRPLAS